MEDKQYHPSVVEVLEETYHDTNQIMWIGK